MPRPPEAPKSSDERDGQHPRRYVELDFKGGVKDSFVSALRLGRYRLYTNVVMELVDNGANAAVETPDQTTQIIVTVPSKNPNDYAFNQIRVEAVREDGMGFDELNTMLAAGVSRKKGSGQFGVGFNEAAWSGNDLVVVTKKRGEPTEIIFEEAGFGDPEVDYKGKRPVTERSAKDVDVGRVDVRIKNLKGADSDWPTKAEVAHAIAETYSSRLAIERVKFDRSKNYPASPRPFIDSTGTHVELHDRFFAWVVGSKSADQVLPLDLQLEDGYSEELQMARTGEGEVVPYWVAERKPEARQIKPGLRYYHSGRLIAEGGLAGHNDKDPRLSRVIGAVHADHVANFKAQVLSLSKSATKVNADAPEWVRLNGAVYEAISPFIETLMERPMQTDAVLSTRLLDAMQAGRRYADQVVGELLSQGLLDGFGGQAGIARGQHPSHVEDKEHGPEDSGQPLGVEGTSWAKQRRRTYPTEGTSTEIPRKRKGLIHEVKPSVFAEDDPRATAILEQGKRRILLVNTNYPDVQTAMKDGDPLHAEYLMKSLITRELVTHAVSEAAKGTLEGRELKHLVDVLIQLEQGKYEAAKLVRSDPATHLMENRETLERSTRPSKKK